MNVVALTAIRIHALCIWADELKPYRPRTPPCRYYKCYFDGERKGVSARLSGISRRLLVHACLAMRYGFWLFGTGRNDNIRCCSPAVYDRTPRDFSGASLLACTLSGG